MYSIALFSASISLQDIFTCPVQFKLWLLLIHVFGFSLSRLFPNNHGMIHYMCILNHLYRSIFMKRFAGLFPCRMDDTEATQGSCLSAVPERSVVGHSGQVPEAAGPSKHREHPSKSPRRWREGKRTQWRGGDHEQLLRETERRRLPGQHEHSEPSSSASEAAENSPKRFVKCCRWPDSTASQLSHWHGAAALRHVVVTVFDFVILFSPHRRAHFLHGPYPATHFGPKACILPNPTSVM